MDFEGSIKKAAHKADRAVKKAMKKYENGLVTDEDDITGVLIGNLDNAIEEQIGDIRWSTSVVRHRKGTAAEEALTGADILIHVSINTVLVKYSKGVLIQSKRIVSGAALPAPELTRLHKQCGVMLAITPAAFVFNYMTGEMRCGSASRIHRSPNRILSEQCIWTSYRFFLELFRSPIGDPRITSARVADLPVANTVEMVGVGVE